MQPNSMDNVDRMRFMKVGLYAPKWDVRVNFQQDPEANVWTATSEDVPGLALEDEDLDRLKERVKEAIPELICLNQ